MATRLDFESMKYKDYEKPKKGLHNIMYDTILTSGKYTGLSAAKVFKNDPQYFVWLSQNTLIHISACLLPTPKKSKQSKYTELNTNASKEQKEANLLHFLKTNKLKPINGRDTFKATSVNSSVLLGESSQHNGSLSLKP